MEALLDCLEWDDGLQVGVKQIDEQHKRLFGLLKEISAISMYYKQLDKINPVVDELIDHVIRCFNEEEQAMKGHGYPGLAIQEQQQQHLVFVKMLILELDLRHLNKLPTIELLERLANLLRDHIMTVDKKYASFLGAAENFCTKQRCMDMGATSDLRLAGLSG